MIDIRIDYFLEAAQPDGGWSLVWMKEGDDCYASHTADQELAIARAKESESVLRVVRRALIEVREVIY